MFIKLTRSGPRQYLQLVEAWRDEQGKTRHRHVANLGRVEEAPALIEGLLRGLDRATGVKGPKRVEFERALEVGGTWVLTQVWNQLGLSRCFRGLTRSDARLDLEALTRVMVFNRLCDPQSKLGVLRWLEGVLVPGVSAAEVTHQRLLRAMDVLDAKVDTILSRLAGLVRPLLDQDLNLVFYDLTTIRIHGEGQVDGDLRGYGRSKDTAGIDRQVALGLVQSGCGMPLDFQIHEGSVSEVTTLLPMVERCLARYPIRRVVLVADRGLLSLEQVEALEALRLPPGVELNWILAVPARRYGDFMDPVVALAGTLPQDAPSVAETAHQGRRLVLAHDPEMARLQREARLAQIERIEADAQAAVDKLDRQDRGKNARGRRATDRGAFLRFVEAVKDAGLSKILKPDLKADRFLWQLDREALARQEAFDGKLVLLTNIRDLTPAQVIERYKRLADIERGFRVLKQDIAIAPVHHRLPERIRAHGLICFLALLLHRTLRPKLSDRSPSAALEQLRAIQLQRVTTDGRSTQGLSKNTPATREILKQLDLTLPEPDRLTAA